MFIDTFIRGFISAQDLEYYSHSITFRAYGYLSCSLFLINIILIRNGNNVHSVTNFFTFSMLFRIMGKIFEFIYVYSISAHPGPKRMLVEFNVASVLEIAIFQSTGLFTFNKIVYVNIFLGFMGVFSHFLVTQDYYKSVYYTFNMGWLIVFNLLEYWVFAKDQMDNFKKLIEIDRQSYKVEQFVERLLPNHMHNALDSVAGRLAETYDNVTMLYADIVGFTKFSSSHSAREVVEMLSRLFIKFDIECQDLDLFKIYTIGDCYVVMSFTDKNNRKDPSEEALNVVRLS